jgi:DNA-binding PadR family transcriptional regulator
VKTVRVLFGGLPAGMPGRLCAFELIAGHQHRRIRRLPHPGIRGSSIGDLTSKALDRLVRNGLVEVHQTVRSEGYPDRVVYAITDAGRVAAAQWLRDMLRTTGTEYPEFIAAVSVLFGLEPEDARAQLQERADRLATELAETDAVFAENPDLPRLFLLEEEYRRAIVSAELGWVRSVVADIDAGRLTWTEEWLMGLFSEHDPMNPTHERTSHDARSQA